ncbi:AEC family transporter [Streptomyces sp. ICBB 8177]|uniref:AEC family transporter n=1 Tax=Streptomyces sp. ICBB 8177 TaxID=563922 RepID=UPI000D679D0F|nr:AEC family transporter [Streptomyces sp. ICBB 8177]PWI44980.1 transporter [Streptomyces sp. ICBB 8177]
MGTLTALEKLIPVGLAFGCGALFARRKAIPADSSKAFSDFSFLFAIPCYLFGNLYTSDLGTLFDARAICGYMVFALLSMVLVGWASRVSSTREPRGVALRVMGGVQVNTAYFAVPVFTMLFGTAAPIFPVLLFQTCVLTSVIILVMELGADPRPDGPDGEPSVRRRAAARIGRATWASLTTPIVLACAFAIALNLLKVPVPSSVLSGFSFVGNAASPVALFALGLHLGGAGLAVRGTPREEVWLVAFKCLVFPVLIWTGCHYVFGVHGAWLNYLVLIAAMPAPQNLFIFAQRYDVDVDLSAALVIKSSAASLLLLPLWFQVVRLSH